MSIICTEPQTHAWRVETFSPLVNCSVDNVFKHMSVQGNAATYLITLRSGELTNMSFVGNLPVFAAASKEFCKSIKNIETVTAMVRWLTFFGSRCIRQLRVAVHRVLIQYYLRWCYEAASDGLVLSVLSSTTQCLTVTPVGLLRLYRVRIPTSMHAVTL